MKRIYPSPLGDIILVSYQGNLVYSNWDSKDCKRKLEKLEAAIRCSNSDLIEDIQILEEAEIQLVRYFSGEVVTLDVEIDFIGTEFQKKVWRKLLTVGYGQTISYKELANRCNNPASVRAIANACGANPLALFVPCHRVVASNGGYGGYTGGLDKKMALLDWERQRLNCPNLK